MIGILQNLVNHQGAAGLIVAAFAAFGVGCLLSSIASPFLNRFIERERHHG